MLCELGLLGMPCGLKLILREQASLATLQTPALMIKGERARNGTTFSPDMLGVRSIAPLCLDNGNIS